MDDQTQPPAPESNNNPYTPNPQPSPPPPPSYQPQPDFSQNVPPANPPSAFTATPQPQYQPPQNAYPQPVAAQPPVPPAPPSDIYPQPTANVVSGGPPPSANTLPATNEGSKSFLTTYLLSQFLWFIAADRFYLGKIGTGLLKLITFGGLGIWALIDQIMLLGNHTKAKDGTNLRDYEKNRKIAIIIFILVLLLSAAAGWYDVALINKTVSKINKCNNSCSVNLNFNGSSTSSSPPAKSVSTETPLGQTATGNGDAAGWAVKISPDQNPTTTGAAPNSGMHYLEVAFSVTNNTGTSGLLPGSFYYQTAGGKLYNDTSTQGTGPNIDAKDAQLANSNLQPLIAINVNKGTSDTSHYLLYQVPDGDNGKLIWFDGIYETNTKLAIFDLK